MSTRQPACEVPAAPALADVAAASVVVLLASVPWLSSLSHLSNPSYGAAQFILFLNRGYCHHLTRDPIELGTSVSHFGVMRCP